MKVHKARIWQASAHFTICHVGPRDSSNGDDADRTQCCPP